MRSQGGVHTQAPPSAVPPIGIPNLPTTRKPLVAQSYDMMASNTAGIVTVRDSVGTPRTLRIVQKEEEDEKKNMLRVSWFYTFEDTSFTITLRHGSVSGIRKIYVNDDLVLRDKKWAYAISGKGSTHEFKVGTKLARVEITPTYGRDDPKGYTYQLYIDGRMVEQAPHAPSPSTKTRIVRVEKNKRIGMTLQNNADGPGVVVVQFQEVSAARDAGVQVGDVLIAVNGEPVNTHEIAVYKIDNVREGDAFLLSVHEENVLTARGVRQDLVYQ